MPFIALIIAVLLIVIDQIIKILISSNMTLGEVINVIYFGDVKLFNLHYILNDGAGFSILSGRTGILLALTFVFLTAIIFYMFKKPKNTKLEITAFALIIGGGFGNMIDRIFNDGKVVDYIETAFMNFPIFNFADICVVIGSALYVLFIFFFDKDSKKTSVK